jgi:hypothetical protein
MISRKGPSVMRRKTDRKEMKIRWRKEGRQQ